MLSTLCIMGKLDSAGERVRDLFARAATLSFEKHVLHLLNDENYSPNKKRRFMDAKQMMIKKGNKETETVYRTLSIQHCKYVFY